MITFSCFCSFLSLVLATSRFGALAADDDERSPKNMAKLVPSVMTEKGAQAREANAEDNHILRC